MKKLIIGLFLSITTMGFAQNGEKNFIDQNYIEVTGKAEMEIIPDMIYLKIILSDKDNKDKLALPEIEQRMTNKLSEIGIDIKKDLSLQDFTSNMKSYWLKSNISLTKQYQLIVHDTKILQKVFFEFQNLGISNVSIINEEHSKIEQYRKEVKINAIKAAKEKADMLAVAINQNIGKALYIQEADNLNPLLTANNIKGKLSGINVKIGNFSSDSGSDSASDIEFEKIKIVSSILVRFELK
ncbi:MAG: SIMPL domain-containing protein [Dysgonamonadaceae bacterium]